MRYFNYMQKSVYLSRFQKAVIWETPKHTAKFDINCNSYDEN